MRFLSGLGGAGGCAGRGSADGEQRGTGLVSSEIAHRHGLDLAWHTQVHVNRANGRVTHITQHVTDWVSVEVKLNELTWRYKSAIGIAAA